jgi:thymidylate synthase
MKVIRGINNIHTMLLMYQAVSKGYEMETRGAKCRNVPNMAVILQANECPLTSFRPRALNLEYAKAEWLWYLSADKMDDSIEKYATMWKKLKQEDGSYYSNYGQYIFGDQPDRPSQFEYVIQQLKKDPSSRRASIVLLKQDHLFDENVDTVCTYSINFTIVNNVLDMTVMMRSNDVIFGFTNDAFCFWNLYAMVYAILKHTMPGLATGNYTHFTNSMHVYERHFAMIHAINTTHNGDHIRQPAIPWPTAKESLELFKTRGKGGEGAYTTWLKAGHG